MANLITAQEVVELAFAENSNMREESISDTSIRIAEIKYIKPVFGNMYAMLGTAYADFTNQYIKPALAYFVKCEIVSSIAIDMSNSGIAVANPQYQSAASDKQRQRLYDSEMSKAKVLLDDALAYISSHREEFPDFEGQTPKRHYRNGGLILGVGTAPKQQYITDNAVSRPEFEALTAKVAEVEREQDNYVKKELGKGLSSNNYTDADKAVVSNIKGIGTKTNNKAEVAIGQYNVSSDNTLFSVGNGKCEDARRNAFEVRGARPLSATAYRLDIESDEDTLQAYNVKLAYVGQREDYIGEGDTNDAYIIYSSDDNVGVGTIVTIKVDEWDANDPMWSSRIAWVRDESAEWDYYSVSVVVYRILNDAVVDGNIVATTPSGDPMHYAYELEGAVWQPEDMLWSLNGINDLTTEEIRAIYAERFVGNNHSIMSNWWASTQQRTNMCRATNGSASSIANAFIHSKTIEAATLGTAAFYSWKSVFQNCSALRSIVGELNWKYMTASSHIDANVFKGCTSLEEVRIKDLKQSVSFADSPRLSEASVLFMIQNASPTSAITITLDEGVRDNLYDDPEIEAALAAHPLVTLGI